MACRNIEWGFCADPFKVAPLLFEQGRIIRLPIYNQLRSDKMIEVDKSGNLSCLNSFIGVHPTESMCLVDLANRI